MVGDVCMKKEKGGLFTLMIGKGPERKRSREMFIA